MRYSTKQANSVVIGNTSPDMSTTADRLVPDEPADHVDPSDVNVCLASNNTDTSKRYLFGCNETSLRCCWPL